MPRVAVVSVAQTHHGERLDKTCRELVYEVCRGALDRVGLGIGDLETIVTASSDYWQGMGCSNVYYYEAAASYLKDSPKVEGDSSHAFLYACLRLLSGHFDIALVASVTKCSEVPSLATLTNLSCDPFYQRPLGLDELAAAGLQAQLYLRRYGPGEEALAKVASKNLRHALSNPHAHRKVDVTAEGVMASPMAAFPLRALECAPGSDGACAIVLASEERAKKLSANPAWVKGFGWATETYALGERDLLTGNGLREAARRAYAMARIDDPSRQLSLIELVAPYAHQELLWYEGLGMCEQGRGWRLVEDGTTDLDGPLPVNPSGGVLSTNPYVARGLIRVGEAALQLMGEASARQVEGATTALAHSTYGLAGQAHTVVVLGKE
ncbi:MAG: thiolase family protein [Dehalococcoidia bacterium]